MELLEKMPPLAGANRLAGAVAGTTVLAVHPTLKGHDGQPMPVLATREVGRGRTLAFAVDSSWHWAFQAVGAGGTREGYDRFWRNAIRWLIKDPELQYLRIILQGDAIRLGTNLRAIVRAYNPDYSPAAALNVEYQIGRPEGGASVSRKGTTNQHGELRIDFEPKEVGAYEIKATATLGGRRTQARALALVEAAGLELEQPRATPILLQRISEQTAGRYLGNIDSLPDLPFRDPRILRVNWRRNEEIWRQWWWLLGVLFLLAAEWAVRRRMGYL
jgi:hypothetical protein